MAGKTAKKATKKVSPVKKSAKKNSKIKSSAKKKPAKKADQKKTAVQPKLTVYRLAQDAPGERYFVLANGIPVRHVAELAEVMEDIEDHVFAHHVNEEGNDFHNWVKDVFKDVQLAKKILGVKSKEHLQLTIYKHVANKAFNHR